MTISGYTVLIGGLASLLLLTACDEPEQWSAGDLRGYNHTLEAINWFNVNDEATGSSMMPGGEAGGMCCISLPGKWRPGLKAHVNWEVDSLPYANLPALGSDAYREAYARHAANYKRYSQTIDIPDYGDKKCGLTVHFIACRQIKVTATCLTPQHPGYPINEPFQQKEPAVCPQ
ncbi:DUF3304 domain-containing protein [Siccibacter colletis]|uniref:DUF3304 domain-containing protein n=1 Tax=Siccibacter colletis TaxID=1505757 RepID=UPI0028BD4FDF|nr:DUF3304 domain-containing protein [Siccibacter colletis]WNN50006.1 DUF3304 domain-containing protein [Siccibacter colletis]